jgi:hypothetical protein
MSAALKFVARQNNAFHITIDAYRDSLIYGIGWMNTGFHIRDADPRSEPVQMMRCDPARFALTHRASRPIWRTLATSSGRARSSTRCVACFPETRRASTSNRALKYDAYNDDDNGPYKVYDGVIDLVPPPSMWDELEDWNMVRRTTTTPTQRITVHELWERVSVREMVMETINGVVKEFDPEDDEAMAEALGPTVRRFYEADVPHVRYHVFSGTTLLISADSPYKHGRLPFVPVWHKRDRHGDPFSMIETLKDPQREINHRRVTSAVGTDFQQHSYFAKGVCCHANDA